LNWNAVVPTGVVEVFFPVLVEYFEVNPNVAGPVSEGFATYAPDGEAMVPDPATYPPFGS